MKDDKRLSQAENPAKSTVPELSVKGKDGARSDLVLAFVLDALHQEGVEIHTVRCDGVGR
jgi:hypothetical protein